MTLQIQFVALVRPTEVIKYGYVAQPEISRSDAKNGWIVAKNPVDYRDVKPRTDHVTDSV